jgi:hypothetical protein
MAALELKEYHKRLEILGSKEKDTLIHVADREDAS